MCCGIAIFIKMLQFGLMWILFINLLNELIYILKDTCKSNQIVEKKSVYMAPILNSYFDS